jgi:hypothetical protein
VATATRPIFLLSLPRSGSTLLQRMLASHTDIATASEPWVMLPYVYTGRERGVRAEYGHRTMARAMEDFCESLPGGRATYRQAMAGMARDLYTHAAGGRTYFLDKSPRYHLIVQDLLELFPDAKLVLLWRQPIAVAASIIESFGSGHWNLERYSVDLFEGLGNLVEAARTSSDRFHVVRYEQVLVNPDSELDQLFAFLELDVEPDAARAFSSVSLRGRMGDRTGTRSYSTLAQEPLEKWRRTMGTPLRRWWAERYLRWIGGDRLQIMGYDLELLLAQVREARADRHTTASDLSRMAYGFAQGTLVNRMTARRGAVAGALPLRVDG